MTVTVSPIAYSAAVEIVEAHHYSSVMPRITKVTLGVFLDNETLGCITLGWGTRPFHTIRKLFPSLGTADYLELGKFCLKDRPEQFESQALAAMHRWVKRNKPEVKLVFSWADGILGKPGYVYQAANYLYGGFIWTEMYMTAEGKRIHPRTFQGISDAKVPGKLASRAYGETMRQGLTKYFGKQFRYAYFLCGHKEQKALLAESPFLWSGKYPKRVDCEWKVQAGEGSRVSCVQPVYAGSVRSRPPAPMFDMLVEASNG